jgi:hypothetical protein
VHGELGGLADLPQRYGAVLNLLGADAVLGEMAGCVSSSAAKQQKQA